jgi:hypothetical protein
MIEDQKIQVESCQDHQKTADIMTKALPQPKFKQHTSEMGVTAA